MLYNWQDPHSLIHRAEIYQPSKYAEAILYAPEHADPEKLHHLDQQLKAAGFNTVADVEGGSAALHIMQIESPEKLLDVLRLNGGVMGEASVTKTHRDVLYEKSPLQKVKENAASTAGYLYVLADAVMMLSGYIRAKGLQKQDGGISELMTGLAWAVPNLNLAINGKKDPKFQTAALMEGFDKYVKEQGIQLPEGEAMTIENLTKSSGMLEAAHRFLSDHAITINNTGEAIGGMIMTKAGWQQRPGLSDQPNYFKMAAGNFVTTGMGLSVLLPEKKTMMHLDGSPVIHDSREKAGGDLSAPVQEQGAAGAKEGESGFKSWFQKEVLDHPMRLAGYLPMGNNISNLVGSLWWEPKKLKEFKDKEHPAAVAKLEKQIANIPKVSADTLDEAQRRNLGELQKSLDGLHDKLNEAENFKKGASLNTLSAGLFMLANLTYSTASKNGGSKLEKAGGLNNVLAVAANVVASQPQQKQSALVEHIATALAAEKDICVAESELSAALHEKVAALGKNPWAQRVRVPAPANGNSLDAGPAVA